MTPFAILREENKRLSRELAQPEEGQSPDRVTTNTRASFIWKGVEIFRWVATLCR